MTLFAGHSWVILVLGCNADPVAIYGICGLLGYSWVALVLACTADLVAIYGICALLGCSWVGLVFTRGVVLHGGLGWQ